MPIIQSFYRPPAYLFSGHLQTIAPVLSVKRDNTLYKTEKLELADGDFLEIDWVRGGNDKLMILFHGLEGNSRSHYVQQMAVHFKNIGWDILAMHARSCGREMNRLPKLYHGGSTEDIESVVNEYANKYQSVVLMGFSLGANMALNYAARHETPANLLAIGTFSVPCNLRDSEKKIDRFINRIYKKKFLDKLKNKVRKMIVTHPDKYDISILDDVTTIGGFSANFTSPFSGFTSLDEFYSVGSCLDSLKKITIPTLIVNAQNDPFLSKSCFPVDLAKASENIFLDMPKQGGHTGFPISMTESWMPLRLEQFLKETVGI